MDINLADYTKGADIQGVLQSYLADRKVQAEIQVCTSKVR
jgi:hypothetical protein